MNWLLFAVAFAIGGFVTLQTGSNTRLKETLGEPLIALILSSCLGVAALISIAMMARRPWPSVEQLAAASWWAWLGGLLGAAYAVVVVLLAKPLGAAPLTAALVTGQLACSVVLDHFGWVGFEQHAANPLRLVGCALMIVGFVLIARF